MISHPRFLTLISYEREGQKASFTPRKCGLFQSLLLNALLAFGPGGGWQLIFIRSENGGHSRLVNGLQDDPDSADNETESKRAHHRPKLKQV